MLEPRVWRWAVGEDEARLSPRACRRAKGSHYGSVSLLVNREPASRAGARVLLIEGTNIESTEAAANFAFDNAMSKNALRTAGGAAPSAGTSHYRFETLLRTRAVSGASRDTEVAATRYSAGDH